MDKPSPSRHTTRPVAVRSPFTAAHVQHAEELAQNMPALIDAERSRRTARITYPIDNVPAEVAADRDDGIFVEASERADGGYRVYVTIADVAGVVPMGSPLERAIRARAFTVYRPTMIDSMLPKVLEHQLSLEHGQERLALTVRIDLDAHFCPVHTELERSITKANATSYELAQQKVSYDPQFQLMSRIARGLRSEYFGHDWHELEEKVRKDAKTAHLSNQQITSTLTVATYMLLGNSAIASLFQGTDLPFAFRNFIHENMRQQHMAHGNVPIVGKAYYDTRSQGHTEVERDGPRGPYGHFTSPIRRAPDYYCDG
jgi:exoribonuclease R